MTKVDTAVFGLGCFWDSEEAFARLPGVKDVVVGYAGGTSDHPTYHNRADHAEVVKVDYDPHQISYDDLLDAFWKAHDPTMQYEPHYRSAVLYTDEHQKQVARQAKQHKASEYDQPIVTEIQPLTKFYPAEDYHQHYLAKLRGEAPK